MAKRNSGWYTFEDGYCGWFAGMTAQERRVEIAKHGKIVRFDPE